MKPCSVLKSLKQTRLILLYPNAVRGLKKKDKWTKRKLKTFIMKTSGHRGHLKALRAVKYIEDGSASIMESMTYMILTLPHALGGYALDGAVFNHEIKLKDEASKRLGQKRCFTDLYYKPAKLAVEYESFAFHNSPLEQGKDAMRSATLERQGVEVMHLSTIQLYDKDACMDFAFNLASRLGKRIQIRARKFNEMHVLLRALLPAVKPAVVPMTGDYSKKIQCTMEELCIWSFAYSLNKFQFIKMFHNVRKLRLFYFDSSCPGRYNQQRPIEVRRKT